MEKITKKVKDAVIRGIEEEINLVKGDIEESTGNQRISYARDKVALEKDLGILTCGMPNKCKPVQEAFRRNRGLAIF